MDSNHGMRAGVYMFLTGSDFARAFQMGLI
jgi:hypothetical protein